jgi:hypothetical protein
VHYGGWKEGKWGIIDYSGEWVVEPMFEDLGYKTSDDYVAFLNEDKWSDPDEIPIKFAFYFSIFRKFSYIRYVILLA